jgi:hypothetical protein
VSVHLAAALALLVCLADFGFIRRDLATGQSQLWLGGQPASVTRVSDPLLFWVAAGGKAALATGIIVLCVILLIAP